MHRRTFLSVLAVVMAVVAVVDRADGFPRRRRARNNYNYNYYSYSTGYHQAAAKIHQDSADYQELSAYFNYEQAVKPSLAFSDRIRVTLAVYDSDVRALADSLVAEVHLTELAQSGAPRRVLLPVTLTEHGSGEYAVAEFEIPGSEGNARLIEPAKVYRCFVNLHRQADEFGAASVLGRIPRPYYVATSGPTPLEKARQHIVMRTFKEWYYTENGWPSDESYVMDCHDYYLWATGSCTVGASYGRTILGRLFGGRTPYCDSNRIAELAEEGPIHGDYVRIPGHTFMILAYDSQNNQVWTMEGNYNATIEVAIRPVNGGWTVGHLAGEHIRAELFEVSADEPQDDRMSTSGLHEDSWLN